MLGAQYLLLILVYTRAGLANEEDNLRNALNSIENRQRQLASNYYQLPNKDSDRPLQFDDDNLMFLDSAAPSGYDLPHHSRLGPAPKPAKSYRYYEDDQLGGYDDAEEYQKALNERLLDQLMLDMLKYEDDQESQPPAHHRPQKKSFFREREINEISDNLQNLYPNTGDVDDTFYPATSFRERVKSKLRSSPHRHLVKPYDSEDGADIDDYLNAVNPLWRKYEGVDPDTLSEEDASLFLKYLTDKELQEEELEPEAYGSELRSRDRGKRYWMGSARTPKYAIRKRSADEKPAPSKALVAPTNGTGINGTVANKTASASAVTLTPQQPKKVVKRGQQEVPVDLQSLKPLNIKKKSVDWSNYFGVDKRQKKSNPPSKEQHKNDVLLDQYIQSYILQSVRNSAFNNHGSSGNYRYLPKRDINGKLFFGNGGHKLESDDIEAAEDRIIDNVLKYTGAHEGITDPAELQRIRQKIIDELWIAYNLEKLRENYYDDSELKESAERTKKEHQHSTKKRVAVKKENAELTSADNENEKKNKHNNTASSHSTSKKSFIDYNKYRYDVSDGDNCRVLNQIIDDCWQISGEAKDRDRIFTPYCTLHQVCNICGTKQDSLSCDLSFFTDANAICADEPVCRYTAERVLYLIKNQQPSSYLSAKACDSCISQILPYNVEI